MSIVPASFSNVVVSTMIDNPHLIHHTLLPLHLIIQEHSIICGNNKPEVSTETRNSLRTLLRSQQTFSPGVKEDVHLSAFVWSCPADAIRRDHSDV